MEDSIAELEDLRKRGYLTSILFSTSTPSVGPFEEGVPYWSVEVVGPNVKKSAHRAVKTFEEVGPLAAQLAEEISGPIKTPES